MNYSRVEVIKTKGVNGKYPTKWIQMLYEYDGYFCGSLCGKRLIDAEVVPNEFLDTEQGWSSKFKKFIRKSHGGSAKDSLFDKYGCIREDGVEW